MNKLHRVLALLVAFSFFVPALAAAQVTGSSTVDIQIQSLLSEITSLQQQLRSLVQSVVPSSTPPMWNASSTPPNMMGGGGPGMGMGNCDFGRNLSVGSQGSDVMQLQEMLSGDGFFSASSTGFFGPLTAHALASFQTHFGIAASSSATGFFGPLTRNFLSAHCGGQGGSNHMMGSSTPPSMYPMIPAGMPNGTSTPFWGGPGPRVGTTTGGIWQGPMGNSGSSTAPQMPPPRPCPNNEDQGAAAVLFVPHVILPIMNPCPSEGGNSGPQQY
jgi:peptidoglycan hydrolase-like protein with peptidoglycan-binding domain